MTSVGGTACPGARGRRGGRMTSVRGTAGAGLAGAEKAVA